MKKIQLKICMGTMCYIMGGAELKDLVETLPRDIRERVELSFSPCLGCCNKKQSPPFIELNGKMVAGVSKYGLRQILKEELGDAV